MMLYCETKDEYIFNTYEDMLATKMTPISNSLFDGNCVEINGVIHHVGVTDHDNIIDNMIYVKSDNSAYKYFSHISNWTSLENLSRLIVVNPGN